VVSRIDWIEYCQSSTSNLCIQVDAAINPGNSGGPCLFEGKVCGVAFQGRMFAQSIGYIIPSSILIKMVGEVQALLGKRGPPESVVTLRKFGQFPATFQPVENPYMRRFASLPAGTYI
jgi:S1-C subfamily serine protease